MSDNFFRYFKHGETGAVIRVIAPFASAQLLERTTHEKASQDEGESADEARARHIEAGVAFKYEEVDANEYLATISDEDMAKKLESAPDGSFYDEVTDPETGETKVIALSCETGEPLLDESVPEEAPSEPATDAPVEAMQEAQTETPASTEAAESAPSEAVAAQEGENTPETTPDAPSEATEAPASTPEASEAAA